MLKLFQKDGWEFVRQKGSHVFLRKTMPDGNVLNETIPQHPELKKGMESSLKKRLQESKT